MRRMTLGLLASALLLLVASGASAFQSDMISDYDGITGLAPGDKVNVEIYFDATEQGVQFYTVGILWDEDVFQYNPQSNASVGVPTYVLYGQIGTGMNAMNTNLVPLQDPWLIWGGTTPAGYDQTNIAWYDPSFAGAGGTGYVKLGEIQLEVKANAPTSGTAEIYMASDLSSSILQVFDVSGIPHPVSGTPIIVNLPEPSTALLSGAALLTVYGIRRRVRRR